MKPSSNERFLVRQAPPIVTRAYKHDNSAAVRILKLEVQEGFLDGLSLDFDPGLNVLIGPRGAGKTSIIELIRFCLGVEAYTPTNDRAAREHALSILRGGQCVVTVEIDGTVHEVARSAEDDPPTRPGAADEVPIILSQNEIERIGLNARGRIRLLDDFGEGDQAGSVDEGRLQADVASLTQRIQSESEVVGRLENEILAFRDVDDELAAAEKDQDEILKGFSQLEPQRKELAKIDSQLAALGIRRELLSEAEQNFTNFLAGLDDLEGDAESLLPEWPPDGAQSQDDLGAARSGVQLILDHLRAVRDQSTDAQRDIQKRLQTLSSEQKAARDSSRSLRSKLDEVQSGAGEISRRVTQLREKVSNRESIQKKAKAANASLKKQQSKRKGLLKKLDALRADRFKGRQAVANRLNKQLGPQVKLTVSRYGVLDQYADAIATALQGSRLRYNSLAPQVAERMTPTELVEAVEHGNAAAIASAVQITVDRAEKVIEVLRKAGSEAILKAEVEDAVSIALLDGADYKISPELSTGQRCTAVLPILLSHPDRVLVMDQPEDHLDNAFVADTVVRTLRLAPRDAQLIISTHNANIPVLGEADLVTHLESDGKRGFVKSSASLDNPDTVSAITRVMEGGEEAFRLRAEFYRDHESGD
jgi:DNA repair ATPase RecN